MSEQLRQYLEEGEKRLQREAMARKPLIADSADAAQMHYRRLLNGEDLRALGIKYSRMHLRRLIQAGRFPAPISLGENRRAWVADEIHAWIDSRIRERDTGDATGEMQKAASA
jgi:prophage regulatory protein